MSACGSYEGRVGALPDLEEGPAAKGVDHELVAAERLLRQLGRLGRHADSATGFSNGLSM